MGVAKRLIGNLDPHVKYRKTGPRIVKPRVLTRNDLAWYSLRFKNDPIGFVTCIIGAKPTREQAAILNAIASKEHVSVRSGHGIGKSTSLAWLILWFICTRPEARIPCTAPTSKQLYDILWAEITKWHQRMNYAYHRNITVTSSRVQLRGDRQGSFAVAKVARKEQPEALSGIHADNVLYVIEEASGVDDAIFEVVEGSLTKKGNLCIMAGNPIRRTGYFFDSFHGDREMWDPHHFSSVDSELVDAEYPARMAKKYGRDSNIYKVRVLGEFATFDADQVIDLEWLEMAAQREVEPLDVAEIWGLDVARFGNDESALAKRKGNVLREIKTMSKRDLMYLVGWVMNEWNETDPYERPEKVMVDIIGLGAGVGDRLRELGLPVVDVNVAMSPMNRSEYVLLRDELWFQYRDWLKDDEPSIPDEPKLIGQSSGIKYTFRSTGQKKVEGKDDMKKRGLESPDCADAVCLTFYSADELQIYF